MNKSNGFTVSREDEMRVQDLVHQLLDACREIVGKSMAGQSAEKRGLVLEMTAMDLATQSLFMSDHLGKLICQDAREDVMRARLMGIASGLGQVIGTSPDPIKGALDMHSAQRVAQEAWLKRLADSAQTYDRLKKEGKL